MHGEQLADIVSVEGDEIRNLLALWLGEAQSLTGFNFETNVPSRWEGDRHPRVQNGACATHTRVLSSEFWKNNTATASLSNGPLSTDVTASILKLASFMWGVCVPKIRFWNIGDEARQGQVVI
jgi:hypothetical protein